MIIKNKLKPDPEFIYVRQINYTSWNTFVVFITLTESAKKQKKIYIIHLIFPINLHPPTPHITVTHILLIVPMSTTVFFLSVDI